MTLALPKAFALSGLSCALLIAASNAQSAIDPDTDLDDACWKQTFIEDFDSLDLLGPDNPEGRWKPAYIWGPDIIINQELQYYLDPAIVGPSHSPFSTSEGVLTIEASPTPLKLRSAVAGQSYVSGVLTTEKDFSQKHGRFEAIMKTPSGQGLWSAFWLLPSFDRWPEGVAVLPEIDVMEQLGHDVRTVYTSLHTNQNGPLESSTYDHTGSVDLTADFHRYSVVWDADHVHWYLDREHLVSHPAPADFTRPVHFLLNLAVGGQWPGAPDGSTRFPARLLVDQITAWKDNGAC